MTLQDKVERPEISVDVSGRPKDSLSTQFRLEEIDGLDGINAIPNTASLIFGSQLTIIYGRNGAGKSGFARLIANACFSRYKPAILGNIYDNVAPPVPTAKFHISLDGQRQEALVFSPTSDHAELKRISFFDITVAHQRVSEASPFEFKPSGFDIFPEMARVYAQLTTRLYGDIQSRTRDTKFSESFIGLETDASKSVAFVNATTDLTTVQNLAVYGPSEKARLEEIDKQLTALKSKSQKEVLAALRQARIDLENLGVKIIGIGETFSSLKAISRVELSKNAKAAADTATALGSEQFKRAFFKAVGTVEWQNFAKSAHVLARVENVTYPNAGDHCLLCERPLDDSSRSHIQALLSFVEGDVQRATEVAATSLQSEIDLIQALDINIFPKDSRLREQIRRMDPQAEEAIDKLAAKIVSVRDGALKSLRERTTEEHTLETAEVQELLARTMKQADADIDRLEKEDTTQAIQSLELEHQTLRHREVLSQLLPSIEKHVVDAKWCAQAEKAKSALNPRPITDKEKEFFGEIIGESYRKRLAEECKKLDCALPIELETAGQKGKTVRSLSMKGGHAPDDILSEGEQKAVALADFLTEVALNPTNAGIALDDPVTSQDHERKQLIAERLVEEARQRQVIIFTHDLPFLNQIISCAEREDVNFLAHWIERNPKGQPGQVTLNDVPATSKAYDSAERAKQFLAEAQKGTGSVRHDAICKGMGALRRTIEENVVKKLFKNVVPRWSDRVIVTGLRAISWDHDLADEFVQTYEDLSAYIEGHSHTDEATGAPPEIKDLEQRVNLVEALIKRAKPDRKAQLAKVAISPIVQQAE